MSIHLRKHALVSLLALSLVCTANADDALTPQQVEFFETRIRPVLADHCYECHNSADSAEGGLALDHRAALLQGGENGPIIVPGKPEKSRLLPILKHEVEGMEMPQGGPKLDQKIIANFERWIADGAPDPRSKPPTTDEIAAALSWETKLEQRKQWWSFQPITNPEIPQAAFPTISNHPVDRFIQEKLRGTSLQPAELARPETLVRRLYFALIGLPPSPGELSAWTHQLTTAAPSERQAVYEQLVDELLASPHFGERWARHWMDWIRYAESHGSEGDPINDNAWMYRDYLIRALNADVPYDQLVREHMAGDLLQQPRINSDLGINESALGPIHWRMVFHGFAPTDALDEKVRFTDDQINAFSKAFLGLTISCARCHDHKFDAISQRDYYALFGILGSTRPARIPIELPTAIERNHDSLTQLKPQIRKAIASDWLNAAASLANRLPTNIPTGDDTKQPQSIWYLLAKLSPAVVTREPFSTTWEQLSSTITRPTPSEQTAQVHWDLTNREDYGQWFPKGSGLSEQPQPAGDFAVAPEGASALTGIYPSGVYSHLTSSKHAARLTSPGFIATENSELWVQVIGDGGSTVRFVVQNYPRNGTVYPVPQLNNSWRWQRLDLTYWSGDSLHIELATARDAPLLIKSNDRSWFGIRDAQIVTPGSPRPTEMHEHLFSILAEAKEQSPESIADVAQLYQSAIVAAIKSWAAGTATNEQALLLDACLRGNLLPNSLTELASAKELIQRYRQLEQDIPVPTRVPGLDETVGQDQPLFVRGDHKHPGDAVPRRFLEAIDATPYNTTLSGRQELAADLLRDDNPFTRRVIVNRLWHHLFGEGVVRTPDNFGRLGETPTHPELLDWLATRFQHDGWSLKSTIRLMVTSHTWQQSSIPSSHAQQIDPGNHLLTHANVRRLEAEAIRDTLLSVSGQLDNTLYGNPVSGGIPRRSVYVNVIRNSLDPFLNVFDFPEPFSTVGRRNVTNVPAQSLTMLNDNRITQDARSWAQRTLGNPQLTSDEQRIADMFLTAFSRQATSEEIVRSQQFLASVASELQERQRQFTQLQDEAATREQRLRELLSPIQSRLLNAARQRVQLNQQESPVPISRWEFDADAKDSLGSLHGELRAGATIQDGALVVTKGGHMVTAPLDRTLTTKTLEAWVQLDNLDQRAGGVMTVQTDNGVFFDAIVFAEKASREWLSGSNNFARTQDAGGPPEQEANQRPVHVAITYHADGTIACYRDGQLYGKPYQSSGPYEFPAQRTVVIFGVRHLPAVGNRLLSGRILKAQLYDRALTDAEIAASAQVLPTTVPDADILAQLSAKDRQRVQSWRTELAELQHQLEDLGDVPDAIDPSASWTELARALVTFKEFLYVR